MRVRDDKDLARFEPVYDGVGESANSVAAKTTTDRAPCVWEFCDTTQRLIDLEQQSRTEDRAGVGVVVEGFLKIPTGFRQLADELLAFHTVISFVW